MIKEEKSEKLMDSQTFRLSAAERHRLKQRATSRGISVSRLIRESLQNFKQKNN
jgi:predicted DNA binding CopG/RHH family protein